MSNKVFLSTLARGLACGVYTAGDTGVVATVLEETVVTCLTADPLQPGTVYAGTEGHGRWGGVQPRRRMHLGAAAGGA